MENELKQVQEYFKYVELENHSNSKNEWSTISIYDCVDEGCIYIAKMKKEDFYKLKICGEFDCEHCSFDTGIEYNIGEKTKNFNEILEVLKAIAKIGKTNQQQAFIENGTDCGLGADYREKK